MDEGGLGFDPQVRKSGQVVIRRHAKAVTTLRAMLRNASSTPSRRAIPSR